MCMRMDTKCGGSADDRRNINLDQVAFIVMDTLRKKRN